MWDYIHQCDCTELREALDTRHLEPNHASNEGENPTNHDQYLHRNILIRMKCTLTNRGKNVNIKSASYKVKCSFSIVLASIYMASRRVGSCCACGAYLMIINNK